MLFRRGQSDLNVKGAFLHLLYDALASLGVVVAAVIIFYTGWLWVDPVVALLLVALMLFGTWGLFKKSVSLILDAVPHHIDIKQVRAALAAWPGVAAVHDLHVWSLSTQETALTAHLVMPSRSLCDEEYAAINEVLAKRFDIRHVTLQVERGVCEAGCHDHH